jgi:hypothetical protein
MKNEIIGVVFPLIEAQANNLFEKKKFIFVKYLSHDPNKKSKSNLKKGLKFFLYVSRNKKTLFGEAIIGKVEYLSLNEIPKKYFKDMFLKDFELKEYSKGRENKKMAILHLKSIRKYSQPRKIKMPVGMTGRFLRKEDN